MQLGPVPNIPMEPVPMPINGMQSPSLYSTPLKGSMIPPGMIPPQRMPMNPYYPINYHGSGIFPGNPVGLNMPMMPPQGVFNSSMIQGEFAPFPNIPGARIAWPPQLISSQIIATSPGFNRAASLCRSLVQGSQILPNVPNSPVFADNPPIMNQLPMLNNSFINSPTMVGPPNPPMIGNLPPTAGFPSLYQMR